CWRSPARRVSSRHGARPRPTRPRRCAASDPLGAKRYTSLPETEDADLAVKPIPEGYQSVTPYLIVKGAAQAIEFYKRALGATELMRFADPSGGVGHAEIKIGNSPIMLADEHPEMGYRGPQSLGGTAVSLLVYVEDVDARFSQAIAAGAKALRPVKD